MRQQYSSSMHILWTCFFGHFQGPPMSCVRLAERVVALICCEKLHKIGKSVWKAHVDKNEVKNIVKQKHLKGSRASRVLQAVNARMSVRFGEGGCKCDVAWRPCQMEEFCFHSWAAVIYLLSFLTPFRYINVISSSDCWIVDIYVLCFNVSVSQIISLYLCTNGRLVFQWHS